VFKASVYKQLLEKIVIETKQIPAASVNKRVHLYRKELFLLKALQFQRSFGFLKEFFPFGPVSDAVLPVCCFHFCYIALYIILPSIFRSF
jgi:hypothetical protein